jgi:peroxiredoxin
MSLKSELDAQRAAGAARLAPDVARLFQRSIDDLVASGLTAYSVQDGEDAPDFALPGPDNQVVRLCDELSRGPVVLIFYRGGWCPYCNLALRAFQQALPALAQAGAGLIAVSPESPDRVMTTREKNALGFHVLSDRGNEVARRYGLVFEMPAAVRAVYRARDLDLGEINADGRWELPIPAGFVIGSNGIILRAHLDPDYRSRLEPADALAAIAARPRHRERA